MSRISGVERRVWIYVKAYRPRPKYKLFVRKIIVKCYHAFVSPLAIPVRFVPVIVFSAMHTAQPRRGGKTNGFLNIFVLFFLFFFVFFMVLWFFLGFHIKS